MFATHFLNSIQSVTLGTTALAMLLVGGLVVLLHFLRRGEEGRAAPSGAAGEGEAARRSASPLAQGGTIMRLQWEPSPEQPDGRRHEARDEATGITAVVEWDDPSGPRPWVWYLANYPIVSWEPADGEGPAGRAPTREAAMAAAEQALPTLDESAGLLRREKELYESEL